jgi:hypothetical protein
MGEEVYGRKWKETLMFEIALKCVHCPSLATSGLLEMRTVSSYKDKCLQVVQQEARGSYGAVSGHFQFVFLKGNHLQLSLFLGSIKPLSK